MRNTIRFSPTLGLAAAVLLAGWGLRSAQAQQVFDVRIARPIDIDFLMHQRPARPYVKFVAQREAGYWIGVASDPASEALQSHLGLSKNQGLVVGEVVPDSPSAKAGLKVHDVLLEAGDKTLASVEDLVAAVNASGADPLKLKLIRGGKQMTVELQPAERPAGAGANIPELPQWQDFRILMDQLGNADTGPMQFRFVGPGMVMQRTKLPENLSIAITRQGDQPAKIVVKREDKTWEITEKELDQLPEDIRGHVREMLGRGSAGFGGQFKFQGFEQLPHDVREQLKKSSGTIRSLPKVRVERQGVRVINGPAADNDVQRQMTELRQELDQLRKSLESRDSEREALLKVLMQVLEKTKD